MTKKISCVDLKGYAALFLQIAQFSKFLDKNHTKSFFLQN